MTSRQPFCLSDQRVHGHERHSCRHGLQIDHPGDSVRRIGRDCFNGAAEVHINRHGTTCWDDVDTGRCGVTENRARWFNLTNGLVHPIQRFTRTMAQADTFFPKVTLKPSALMVTTVCSCRWLSFGNLFSCVTNLVMMVLSMHSFVKFTMAACIVIQSPVAAPHRRQRPDQDATCRPSSCRDTRTACTSTTPSSRRASG